MIPRIVFLMPKREETKHGVLQLSVDFLMVTESLPWKENKLEFLDVTLYAGMFFGT